MNKGLTLVEMIAVLIILTIIAIIITPNVYNEIRKSQNRLYDEQIISIRESGKNWVADNIEKVPFDGNGLYLKLSTLIDEGYIDNLEMKEINKNDFFVLVVGEKIEDTGSIESSYQEDCIPGVDFECNVATNYKYTYDTYQTIEDYQKEQAKKYVKENNNLENRTFTVNTTTSELKTKKYLVNKLIDAEGNEVSSSEYKEYNIQAKVTNGEIEITLQ